MFVLGCFFVHFWWTQIPQNLWIHNFCEGIANTIFWGLWLWGCHGCLLFLCDWFGSHDCSFRCLKAIYAIALLTIKRGMRYEMQVWWWDWHFFSHISWKWACMMFFFKAITLSKQCQESHSVLETLEELHGWFHSRGWLPWWMEDGFVSDEVSKLFILGEIW